MINNKTVLITGGTGSFGKNFCEYLITKYPRIKKIIILSRDEYKQSIMKDNLQANSKKKFRFFIGDVRDKDRLMSAFSGVDYVIHAAALKQVPAAEYNPFEFIKTNILGAQNVIEASINNNVKKVISLSTDKASSPVNLYGATKLCSDKLFISANNIKGSNEISFSVVRYGNVLGSRGSLFPVFKKLENKKKFPVTDIRMTRFNITLKDSIKLVDWTLKNSQGGEIIVPKLKSFRVVDFAKAINQKSKIEITGIRPGEKIHEEMISLNDIDNTIELSDKYLIYPKNQKKKFFNFYKKFKPKNYGSKSSYNSNQKLFLNISELKRLINDNLQYLEK